MIDELNKVISVAEKSVAVAPGRHLVQFYETDIYLIQAVSDFVANGIKAGEGAIIIATASHKPKIIENLRTQIDLPFSMACEQLVILDAQVMLEQIMKGSLPDQNALVELMTPMIAKMKSRFSGVRAYGELVNVLWEDGNLHGTIFLESLWEGLISVHDFTLLCGYSMENFRRDIDGVAFKNICMCHSHVQLPERYNGFSETEEYRRLIAELQQKTLALQTEIAERRVMEQELRRSHRDLKQAKEAAENASYTKSRFLANMSHEIRSPLTAILGFTELMKEHTLPEQTRNDYADIVSRSGRQLSTLINDVLDLSKVEAGRLDIELIPMSLPRLIKEVVGLFEKEGQAKNIKLIVKAPSTFPERICSDPTRIHQILTNLIGNAVKFTHEGDIGISYRLLKDGEGPEQIEIKIKDTGIGVREEKREKIFLPFIQADTSTTRKYGGTGLGLALSRKLAEALGGTIELVRTNEKIGSEFSVTFQANLDDLNREAHAQHFNEDLVEQSDKILSDIKILLAEDSPDNQLLIRRYLESEGAIVAIAENGLIAVEMALKGSYDLILMDVMMPVCDGYDATKRLRRTGFRNPIVALTAHALREERERSFAEGCNEHLTKPINRDLLVSTIAKFVYKN